MKRRNGKKLTSPHAAIRELKRSDCEHIDGGSPNGSTPMPTVILPAFIIDGGE